MNYEDLVALEPAADLRRPHGYGKVGPEADKPGFDITAYWARSRPHAIHAKRGQPAGLPVPGIGDHSTAISLYAGIVTGLYRRERTGKGCNVTHFVDRRGASGSAGGVAAGRAVRRQVFGTGRPDEARESARRRKLPNLRRPLAAARVRQGDKNWPVFAKAIGRDGPDWRIRGSPTRRVGAANSAELAGRAGPRVRRSAAGVLEKDARRGPAALRRGAGPRGRS